jgi:hypothetical protein
MEEKKVKKSSAPKNASYYDKNKQKIRIQQRIYYQTHKRKLNLSAKQYYAENKDEVLEKNKTSVRKKNYDKQYYVENKAKIQQRRKHLYQQDKLRTKIKKEVRGNNN